MQKVDLIVESLARAEREEVEAVVEKMVATYPNLAESLLTNIGFELQAMDAKTEEEYV